MANETTSTTIEEIVNSEWIRPVFQDYAHDWVVASQYALPLSLIGRASATIALPRIQSDMGTVGDGGGGVDTEYDATEGTDLSNTQLDLNEATITSSEYGIMRTVTDTAREDSIDAFALMQAIIRDCARILTTALEDDVCALFGSFSNTSGTTTVNLALADMNDAIASIRNRGIRAPGGLAFVLDEQQGLDLEAALVATGTSWAVYPGTAEAQLRAVPDGNNGLTDGRLLSYKGFPVVATGLTDTANTGADVVGAALVRGDESLNAAFAAIGVVTSREFRAATERNESLRAEEIVCTMRKGTGILLDGAGQGIVTDA